MSTYTSEPGTRLAGRYRLVDQTNAGTGWTFWKAIDATLARIARLPHVTAVESPYAAGQHAISPDGTIAFATVSFDEREGPGLAAAKKANYVDKYNRPGADRGWHFLTGPQDSITRLADAVGFHYRYDVRQDQFAHASGIVVQTPAGKVSRYYYDIRYSPRDLCLGLVEASANRIGSPVDQVLLFCFHYDPIEGKYGPAVLRILRVAAVLTILGLAVFMALLIRGDRKRARQALAKVD